jgi:hypothetical protein
MNNRKPNNRPGNAIPPPPDPEEGYDALIAYFTKYSTEELEKAGYLEEASREEVEEVTAAATYQSLCETGLHVNLTRKAYEQLSWLAARQDVAVEDLVKKWIRERLREESRTAEARGKQ